MFQRLFYPNFFLKRLTSTSKLAEIPEKLTKLLFTDKHEWVSVNEKIGTIGLTDYAQKSLGDIVFAQLPEANTTVKQKEECGALESVKAASEIYSPVSGTIIAKNSEVEDNPSLINTSCYDKGWLFKIELQNENELKDLMTKEMYENFLKSDSE